MFARYLGVSDCNSLVDVSSANAAPCSSGHSHAVTFPEMGSVCLSGCVVALLTYVIYVSKTLHLTLKISEH